MSAPRFVHAGTGQGKSVDSKEEVGRMDLELARRPRARRARGAIECGDRRVTLKRWPNVSYDFFCVCDDLLIHARYSA